VNRPVRLYFEPVGGLPRPERITILRGQLTLIRIRIEQGIPLSIEAVERAERLARTLELHEVPA